MSALKEESGKSTGSKTGSTPRTSANARSKRSAVQAANVQLPETIEENRSVGSQCVNNADTWIKFIAWFVVMGSMLGYGMYQHDNSILFGVMILVTVGCGYGGAVEALMKFLEAKGISPTKPLKS